jgi:hypothetical protein
MTDPQDPPRLVDDPESSERVRDLLRECRSDVGTPDDVKRLESRLVPLIWAPPPTVGGPSATTTAGSSAGATAASGAALKTVAAVALAVGLAGGGLWLSKASTSRIEPPAPSSVLDEKPAEATGTTPAEQPTPPPATQPDESAASPKDRPPSSIKERSSPATEATSESESDLLGRAQAALRRDPAQALSLAGEHRRKFPNGMLVQEREVLAIDALERLGRHAEAVARADRFSKSFPGSAHRSKVNAVIGR